MTVPISYVDMSSNYIVGCCRNIVPFLKRFGLNPVTGEVPYAIYVVILLVLLHNLDRDSFNMLIIKRRC